MIIAGGLLVLYAICVFRPLSQYADELEHAFFQAWRRSPVGGTNSLGTRPDLERATHEVEQLQLALNSFKQENQQIRTRLELDPGIRAKMREPFQLISFQNERQVVIEELESLALTNKVVLAREVVDSFPKYTADQRQPSLLWAQLEFMHQLLLLAIHNRIGLIKDVDLPPIQTQPIPGVTQGFVDHIPVRIQLVASMEAIARLLLSLPLKSEEMSTLQLPELPEPKPAFFIDRFLIRKHSLDKPDEVDLDLRTCGFVFRQ